MHVMQFHKSFFFCVCRINSHGREKKVLRAFRIQFFLNLLNFFTLLRLAVFWGSEMIKQNGKIWNFIHGHERNSIEHPELVSCVSYLSPAPKKKEPGKFDLLWKKGREKWWKISERKMLFFPLDKFSPKLIMCKLMQCSLYISDEREIDKLFH